MDNPCVPASCCPNTTEGAETDRASTVARHTYRMMISVQQQTDNDCRLPNKPDYQPAVFPALRRTFHNTPPISNAAAPSDNVPGSGTLGAPNGVVVPCVTV